MRALSLLIVLLFCGSIVAAQEQVLEKSEFDSVVARGQRVTQERLREGSYRITSAFESRSGVSSKPVATILETFEYAKGVTRIVRDEMITGQKKRYETVLGGGVASTRGADGKWRRDSINVLIPMSRPDTDQTNSIFPHKVISRETRYFYLGARKVGDENLGTYSSVETSLIVFDVNGNDYEMKTTNTYSFRGDGTLVKHEHRFEGFSRSNGARSDSSFIIRWELDPTISIIGPETLR
jgi:hypothetical protein